MAPVSANMAQMAQNMSHHGNLSHVTQNSVAPPIIAASPNKAASTSAPLSLVQDKPQPLALTRTPEKKEPDSTGHANGNIESPKSASGAPAALKPQNPETNNKQDIAKTSPSTPKPPEKPTTAPSTPQKSEAANPVTQAEVPAQPKVATANEAPEKSPSKPSEPKPAPTADVAPSQSDSKPVPESANSSQPQEKPPTAQKAEPTPAESAKTDNKAESPAKPEEKKEEPKVEKLAQQQNAVEEKKEEVKVDKPEPPKKEAPVEKEKQEKEPPQKPQPEEKEKPVEKKPEPKPEIKAPAKTETKPTPRSTLKLATVTPPMRKRRQASPKTYDGPTPSKKAADGELGTPESRAKRNRTKVQLYQSPTPELTMATKLSASAGRSTPTKPNDDKLIVFYKNEYLAVRNAEGSFYVCQAMQNVYRTTRKIKIRWLSQDKSDLSGETYKPDFYDITDLECVLTTLSLSRAPSGGGAQILKPAEEARARSILERALRAESGAANIQLTEEHPDGLDLSLFTDESQLENKSRKRTASKTSPRGKQEPSDAKEAPTPVKKARTTPKRSPKSARKAKAPAKQINKRKSAGSTPVVAAASKTATAVTEKADKAKSTPAKSTPAKSAPPKRTPPKRTPAKRTPAKTVATPVLTPTSTREGRRTAAKEPKPAPAPTPSTSTGKATRTPRKPPAKK